MKLDSFIIFWWRWPWNITRNKMRKKGLEEVAWNEGRVPTRKCKVTRRKRFQVLPCGDGWGMEIAGDARCIDKVSTRCNLVHWIAAIPSHINSLPVPVITLDRRCSIDMRCTGGIIGSIGRQVVWNRRTRGTWNCFVLIACKIYLSVTCVFKRYGNAEFSRHGYKLLIYNLILLAIYLKKIKFSSNMLTLNNKEIRHLNLNDVSSIWSNEDQR